MRTDGINRLCIVCGKSFYCTDGDYFCSDKCYDKYDNWNDEDDEELLS